MISFYCSFFCCVRRCFVRCLSFSCVTWLLCSLSLWPLLCSLCRSFDLQSCRSLHVYFNLMISSCLLLVSLFLSSVLYVCVCACYLCISLLCCVFSYGRYVVRSFFISLLLSLLVYVLSPVVSLTIFVVFVRPWFMSFSGLFVVISFVNCFCRSSITYLLIYLSRCFIRFFVCYVCRSLFLYLLV